MLTPNHFVFCGRLALVVGLPIGLLLMLGSFQGAEHAFGLNDKAAHAIAFGCATLVLFVAMPRSRRGELALATLALGALVEVIQGVVGRDADIFDVGADLAGIGVVYLLTKVETLRALVRDQGRKSFWTIRAEDRRRSRRSRGEGLRGENQATRLALEHAGVHSV